MKKILLFTCLMAIAAMALLSCSKKSGDSFECRLPNATVVLETYGDRVKDTFFEKLNKDALGDYQNALNTLDLLEAEYGEEIGEGVISGLKDALSKQTDNNKMYSSVVFNADFSAVTIEMLDDETPERFLQNMEFLVHGKMLDDSKPVFEGVKEALAKCKLITMRDFNQGDFNGIAIKFTGDNAKELKYMPELALAISKNGLNFIGGYYSSVEKAAKGELSGSYAPAVADAISHADGKQVGVLAIIPPANFLNAPQVDEIPENYRAFIKDLKDISFVLNSDKSKILIDLGVHYGSEDTAKRLKSEIIDPYILGFGKLMVASAIKGKELPAINTLASSCEKSIAKLSVSVTQTDIDTFKELQKEAIGGGFGDDDEWEADDDDDDEWEEDNADDDDEWEEADDDSDEADDSDEDWNDDSDD